MESAPEFRSYDAALDELTALSKDKRIVFVIDEYPYLAKAKPAISAMLQHIIDHKWTESRMYLILCGSSMSFMESQVPGKGNNYHYYIFSKGGFTDGLLQAQERGEVQLITLEDLYK